MDYCRYLSRDFEPPRNFEQMLTLITLAVILGGLLASICFGIYILILKVVDSSVQDYLLIRNGKWKSSCESCEEATKEKHQQNQEND